MASKFELNNSTPAAPAGRLNIVWQSDAAGNVSGNIPEPSAGGAVASVFGRTGAVVAASGDYTAAQVTGAVSVTASYADPAWITSLDWTKINNKPAIPNQTPWTQNIDGGGFSLSNTGDIGVGPTARMAVLSAPIDGASDSGALVISTRYLGTLGERIRIAANGNMGIGTPPGDLLHVKSATSYAKIRIEGNSNASTGLMISDAQRTYQVGINIDGAALAYFQIYGQNTGRVMLAIGDGDIKLYLGGSLKTLSVDGSGFVKAA